MTFQEFYQQKKSQAEKRNLDFNFTEIEFKHFYDLKNKVKCFYSDQEFVHVTNDNKSPTMERIDEHLPYSLDNCVWVTKETNNMKQTFIENEKSPSILNQDNKRKLTRIKKLLNSPNTLQKKKEEYLLPIRERIKQENLEATRLRKELERQSKEVELAGMYNEFGKLCLDNNVKMPLRFSDYKRTLTRVNCQITGEPLPEKLSERSIWVMDKTLPVSKDNILCTTKDIQNGLDMFEVNSKLSGIRNISKVFKGVVKKV